MATRVSRVGILTGAAVMMTLALGAPVGAATPADDPWLVVEVTDGDTLDVARGDDVRTVRLIGINAPEAEDCWADEATAALSDVVGHGPVWLTSDETDLDRYDRALRYVRDADGDDVGAQLVERGAAIASSYPPDTDNDRRYALLQVAARRDGLGLWAPDACPGGISEALPLVGGTIEIDIHENAAGDDNHNLNDEWVRFTNAGTAALDLSGWTVRDESSSHRYRFGELELAVGASVTLYTGCGADTASERFWCNTDSAVWNNDGDTVYLLDPAGNIVVELSY